MNIQTLCIHSYIHEYTNTLYTYLYSWIYRHSVYIFIFMNIQTHTYTYTYTFTQPYRNILYTLYKKFKSIKFVYVFVHKSSKLIRKTTKTSWSYYYFKFVKIRGKDIISLNASKTSCLQFFCTTRYSWLIILIRGLLCQPQECKKLINYDGLKPKRKLFAVKESSLLV